mgnify:CR=1 FL=1
MDNFGGAGVKIGTFTAEVLQQILGSVSGCCAVAVLPPTSAVATVAWQNSPPKFGAQNIASHCSKTVLWVNIRTLSLEVSSNLLFPERVPQVVRKEAETHILEAIFLFKNDASNSDAF